MIIRYKCSCLNALYVDEFVNNNFNEYLINFKEC